MLQKMRLLCAFVAFCVIFLPISAMADAADPKPKSTPKPTAAPTPVPISEDLPYLIYVEKGSHTVQIYAKDESGDYTVPVMAFLAAVGAGSKTPKGSFTILSKERWHTFNSSSETRDYTYVQYATRFTGGLYFHSPLYVQKEEDTMINATYGEIGESVTSGCIRMSAGAAYWIYENCPAGTKIEIVNDTPLGLASDALPKITTRGIDPTDPKFSKETVETVSNKMVTLTLDRESAQLKVGGVILLMPSVVPPDDKIVLNWASSDNTVLRVDENGRVTGLKPGRAKVTVFSIDRGLSAVCDVVVR